jgi:glycerophosphoryl diester phosphodiesterase
MRRVLKIGHRGAPAICPENTMLSFQTAIERGADGLEMDIRQCKDSLVIFHDEDLKRIAGVDVKLKDINLSDLEKYNIPSLHDVLKRFAPQNILLFLELKELDIAEQAAGVVRQYVQENNAEERVIIIGFLKEAYKIAKKHAPEIKHGINIDLYAENNVSEEDILKEITKAVELKPDYILPHYSIINNALVSEINKYNIKTAIWTCRTAQSVNDSVKAGVHAIMVDDPEYYKLMK